MLFFADLWEYAYTVDINSSGRAWSSGTSSTGSAWKSSTTSTTRPSGKSKCSSSSVVWMISCFTCATARRSTAPSPSTWRPRCIRRAWRSRWTRRWWSWTRCRGKRAGSCMGFAGSPTTRCRSRGSTIGGACCGRIRGRSLTWWNATATPCRWRSRRKCSRMSWFTPIRSLRNGAAGDDTEHEKLFVRFSIESRHSTSTWSDCFFLSLLVRNNSEFVAANNSFVVIDTIESLWGGVLDFFPVFVHRLCRISFNA